MNTYQMQLPDNLAALFSLRKENSAYVVEGKQSNEEKTFDASNEAQNYSTAIAWMENELEAYVEANEPPAQDYKEEAYRSHIQREADWPQVFHPDGCFWCGSQSHPSDCCPNRD